MFYFDMGHLLKHPLCLTHKIQVILLKVWLHAKLKYETNTVPNTKEIDKFQYLKYTFTTFYT
jgi:hypothetical protein